MISRLWTSLILKLACATTFLWLVAFMYEMGIRPVRDVVIMFKRQPKISRVLLGAFFLGMWLFAGLKPDGDYGIMEMWNYGNAELNISTNTPQGNSALDNGCLHNSTITQSNADSCVSTQMGNSSIAQLHNSTIPQYPISSTNTTRTITGDDFRRGFVQTRIGTGESFDFSAPSNAVACADWRAFGAAKDWIYVAFTNWVFQVATNDVNRLRVYSFGKIEPLVREADGTIAANYWFVPFMASLGVVPNANWDWLAESDRPSQVWHAITPEDSLLVTWQNALLDRDTDKPLSFQVEFKPGGQFIYRYDLSRLNADTITNILAGAAFADNALTTNTIPTNVTSMAFCQLTANDAFNQDADNDGLPTIDELFVYNTDPHNPDTDYDGLSDYDELFVHNTDPLNPHSVSKVYSDGFAVRLCDLDPFACPEGSTNTIYEHIFYSGTTNGVFAYPQSTEETAVLKVMVSGTDAGDLIIGDTVVPLVGSLTGFTGLRSGNNPDNLVNPVTNTLLVAVGKGKKMSLWFRKPDGLEAAMASDDFMIGEIPTWYKPKGWIAFPHTDTTAPCIHDFNSNRKYMTLIHGEEFPGLTAEWSGGGADVTIVNEQQICANVYGRFPRNLERSIFYTVDHPNRQNPVPLTFQQTLRFCPRLEDMQATGLGGGEALGDVEDWPYHWGCGCLPDVLCECCPGDVCNCPAWNCPCANNRPSSLGDGTEEEAAAAEFTNIVNGTQTELPDVLYLYRSNVRSEFLEVPAGTPHHCCPCPEHRQTNYVARAFKSSRVAVKNQGGGDFEIGYEPCTVAISGVSPSLRFRDSSVLFVTNGASYKRIDCTVLGVKFESEEGRASLSNYNHRSSSLGYPVAVCTNLLYASTLVMDTDVLLTNGFVRISMSGVSGDIALWLPEWWDSHGVWHPAEPLLQAGVKEERFITIRRWRNVMWRHSGLRALAVKVLSSRPSACMVRFEFASSDGTGRVHDFAEQRITTLMPVFMPDYNRNFDADLADAIDQGNRRTLYFWTNHDTWRGDDAFAGYSEGFHLFPMTLPDNGDDLVVNGRNDLVNLCPFTVNLSPLVEAWGMGGVRYEFYTGSPGSVRFVPVCAKWKGLDRIVRGETKTIDGSNLHSAQLMVTSSAPGGESGYVLPQGLLSLGVSESGVMAVEFASAALHELRVVAEDNASGEALFESSVLVRAMDVHDMYRWLNLFYACDKTTEPKYDDRLSVQWPDSEHADANVVFVHGYNMHPDEAWDWSQAMFKRLWWSGMDAGFTAVLWRGNETQKWIPGKNCYATLNYHQNVLNAFRTAGVFATKVNGLYGAKKYMAAHSLGNMLVSAARQSHGLQYEKYFMLNAAVPVEAYDPTDGVTVESKRDMTPPGWRPYPDRVRSTHWHELFLPMPSDARTNLTWKGRFKDVDKTINFYSSMDEVVANGNEDVEELLSRKYAWYNQEQYKGSYLISFSPEAGWKFGSHYLVEVEDTGWPGNNNTMLGPRYRKYTPEETASIADTNLMVRPFFKDFRAEEIYGEGGSGFVSTNNIVFWHALSYGIPAESFAVGANQVPRWGATVEGNIMESKDFETGLIRNVDMAKNCVPGTDEDDTYEDNKELPWIHSYFIKNSLFDTTVLYEALVEKIGSTKPKEKK